jgi:hypothetical protein
MKFLSRFRVAALCALSGAVLALLGTVGPVQNAVSQGMQQITNLAGTEQISLNYPCTVSCFTTSLSLAGLNNSQPTRNNVLIGGDATTNLWQRATTGSSVTTTVTYGGPDRWAYWSGASTAMTVSRDSTAADLPASAYQYGFKMARTSGQTGVVQVCMAQEIESVNSYQLAGSTVEFDFHATAGANFSAASSNMTAYIVYGTSTDEGMASLAKGLNGGGGGSAGWTGQANATAAVIPITTTNARYAAIATVPATATEVGVALCFTPVGTAGTNDYIAFSGIQLVRNSALASKVSATLGYACTTINCTGFDRRQQGDETDLQYRYYYQVNDNVANTVPITLCQATTTSAVVCPIPFPVTMRTAPTATASASTAFGDTATAGAPTACTGFAVVASSTSVQTGKVTCTAGATTTAGGSSQLVGANTAANVNFSAEL